MRIERDARGSGPLVSGFGSGGFRIDDASHRAALLTTAESHEWAPPALNVLTVDDLAPLLAARPEFIILGTGPTLIRPSPALADALDARGLGLEPMDSRAAARAWNVLRAEGREVAAALYPLL